jgi:hypothetical protein
MWGLLLTSLLLGCAPRSTCPNFPLPSDPLKERLDAWAADDRDLYVWLNRLRHLCQSLGDCE